MDELATRYPPLNSGAPCLDFANTYEPQTPAGGDRDHLGADYAGLLAWTRHAGLLDAGAAERLAARAAQAPARAAGAFADARALRDAMIAVFSAAAAVSKLPEPAMGHLRDCFAEAIAAGRLAQTGNRLRWSWDLDSDVRAPLWPLAASAVALLTAGQLARVKQCDGECCHVLFVDMTKNSSRRWCLMRFCGNVSKSRRQAARRRATRGRTGPP